MSMVPELHDQFETYFNQFNEFNTKDIITKSVSVPEIIKKKNNDIIKEEAKQKLTLRENAFKLISHLIWTQLFFSDIIILVIILGIMLDIPILHKFDFNIFDKLIDFLKYFIGATIVEMLGMLFFVIKFLFSKNALEKDSD